jgi:hypothetical protein
MNDHKKGMSGLINEEQMNRDLRAGGFILVVILVAIICPAVVTRCLDRRKRSGYVRVEPKMSEKR